MLSRGTWVRLWKSLDISPAVLKGALQNAIAPTACIWIIQSRTLNLNFDITGFLPAVIALIQPSYAPRISYLRCTFWVAVLSALGFGVSTLAAVSISSARRNTTPPGGDLNAYNSSAAAVAGVWLTFSIWFFQTWRTFHAAVGRALIFVTMYCTITIIYNVHMPDMATMTRYNLQLWVMWLLGFAFATASSLFIFPITSRDVAKAGLKDVIQKTKKATSLTRPFGDELTFDLADDSTVNPQLVGLSRAFAKLQIDAGDAKKDAGWTRFDEADIKELIRHFRLFILPIRGLFAAESIRPTLKHAELSPLTGKAGVHGFTISEKGQLHWDAIFDGLQQPLINLGQMVEDAMDHCRKSLRLNEPGRWNYYRRYVARKEAKNDTASEEGASGMPGGSEFAVGLQKQVFQQQKMLQTVLRDLIEDELKPPPGLQQISHDSLDHEALNGFQGRLLFILYIEHLYNGILDGMVGLTNFCDTKRLSFPRRLRLPATEKAVKMLFFKTSSHFSDNDYGEFGTEMPANVLPTAYDHKFKHLQVGSGFNLKSLRVYYHRFRYFISYVTELLGSEQSFFGLRVACAVMTLAIVALLGNTQQWFFNRRGIWSIIFIPFAMAPTSGESMSMLLLRAGGTCLGVPTAFANWYMVNGVPAGVIVFYFVFQFLTQIMLIKNPYYGAFWRPVGYTHAIIIGYSLQTHYFRVPLAPATETDPYHVYLIGPYRAICVLLGIFVGFIWTAFPKPITIKAVMRRRIGQALFTLTEYHSCMHAAIDAWAKGQQGDAEDKKSLARIHLKTRHRLFIKETEILGLIREHHSYAKWDGIFGHSYPGEKFMAITEEIDQMMSCFNVVILIASQFSFRNAEREEEGTDPEKRPWEEGVRDLLDSFKTTSKQLAALMHILASSMTNNQPLPPFLEVPQPFAIARKMKKLRPDLMDPVHIGEEGYKAIAVIEVGIALMTRSLDRILQLVKEMNGELWTRDVNDQEKQWQPKEPPMATVGDC